MKKTGIMTDSHSGILENEASKLGIAVLPMPFYIDEKLYREGVDISREEFYEMLRKGADVATSQPSPESVMHMWSAMLQEYEELVYIPISSGLSGSCMTAQAMAQEAPYGSASENSYGHCICLRRCTVRFSMPWSLQRKDTVHRKLKTFSKKTDSIWSFMWDSAR